MEYEKHEIDSAKIIYRKYVAIKQYFAGEMDYFKFGVVKEVVSKNLGKKTKDMAACVALYRKYKDLDVIEKVLVLNIKDEPKWWIGLRSGLSTVERRKEEKYNKFLGFVGSSAYIFKREVEKIFADKDFSYEKYFECNKTHKHSLIYAMYENGSISEEVFIILDIIFEGFLDHIYKKSNDFLFEPVYFKLKRYKRFLEKWDIFYIFVYEKIINDFLINE